MSNELKPCPFCGGQPTSAAFPGNRNTWCSNQPRNCHNTAMYSREQWNTRANHSEQALNMVPSIQKMARFLSDKSADMLGNSRESAWVGHGDHFVEVVTEMLAASPAAKGGDV